MNNIDWQALYLQKNPFGIVPNKDEEDIYWAGLESIKAKYDKTFFFITQFRGE